MGEVVGWLVAVFVLGYFVAKSAGRVMKGGLAARGPRPWNASLSDDDRAALARGLDAWQSSEPGVAVDWDVGRLTRSDPAGFISLAALTRALELAPEGLRSDADRAVRETLERLWRERSPGVMPLDEGWYRAPVDDLSADRFAETAYDVLVSSLTPGLVTHGFDPLRGALTLGVEPPEQATHDSHIPSNELWVSLAALRDEAARARAAGQTGELAELLRGILQRWLREESAGVAWLQGRSSGEDRAVALACTQRQRPAA